MGFVFGLMALGLFGQLWWRASDNASWTGPAFIDPPFTPLVWNFLCLVLFFAIHSFGASRWAKSRLFSQNEQTYRRFYLTVNLAAMIILWLAWVPQTSAQALWSASWPWSLGFYSTQLVGLAGLGWTAHHFNVREFFGGKKLGVTGDTLVASGPFSLCRHPTYFFTMLLLVTPHMSAGRAVVAGSSIAYILAGSLLEERKLSRQLGLPYMKYRARTPWLIPTPRSVRRAFQGKARFT